jgi:hypothetical protein
VGVDVVGAGSGQDPGDTGAGQGGRRVGRYEQVGFAGRRTWHRNDVVALQRTSRGSEEHALALLDQFDARHGRAGRDAGVTDTHHDHANPPGASGNRDLDRLNQAENGSTMRLADTA